MKHNVANKTKIFFCKILNDLVIEFENLYVFHIKCVVLMCAFSHKTNVLVFHPNSWRNLEKNMYILTLFLDIHNNNGVY